MSGRNEDPGALPADPFSSHDAERIAKYTGGAVLAALQRAHKDRLTIGAWTHPSGDRSLNTATLRMYAPDGNQIDALDLSVSEAGGMVSALLEAVTECWGPQPPGGEEGDGQGSPRDGT